MLLISRSTSRSSKEERVLRNWAFEKILRKASPSLLELSIETELAAMSTIVSRHVTKGIGTWHMQAASVQDNSREWDHGHRLAGGLSTLWPMALRRNDRRKSHQVSPHSAFVRDLLLTFCDSLEVSIRGQLWSEAHQFAICIQYSNCDRC